MNFCLKLGGIVNGLGKIISGIIECFIGATLFVKSLIIIGLVIALAVVTIVLPPESQATPPDVEEQNQISEEQTSPQGNATATITITMTGIADDSI